MALDTTASLKQALDVIEQRNLDLQNKKELIATKTTAKGVTTDGSDSFQTIADNIDSIKTKLPILEGDVGVTEDSEGNVYGVDKIEERQAYKTKEMTSLIWTNSSTNNNSLIYDITIDKDENIYIGTSGTNNNTVKKISPTGEVSWVSQKNQDAVQRVRVDSYGNVYSNASRYKNGYTEAGVSKIDPNNGEEIWYKPVAYTTYDGAWALDISEDDSIYVGTTSSKKLCKLTTEGIYLWELSIDSTINSIACSKDGYIYIGYSGGFLKKINSDGEEIWTKNISKAANDLKFDNEGNLYCACTSKNILKLNPEGEIIWDLEIISAPKRISINGRNDIYVVTYAANAYTVLKITSEGQIIWTIYIDEGSTLSVATDDKQNIFYSNRYAISKISDNYTLEKVAVLKEREVQ